MFFLTRLGWALPFLRTALRLIAPILFRYGMFIFETAQKIERVHNHMSGKEKFNILWSALKRKVVSDFEHGVIDADFVKMLDPIDGNEANALLKQAINFVVALAKLMMHKEATHD